MIDFATDSNALADQIRRLPGWQNLEVREIWTLLTAKSIEVTDDRLYTWAGVAQVAGPDAAEKIRIALEKNGAGWAVHQLGGSGIPLSDPQAQAMLRLLDAAGVPGCAELAAIGRRMISPLEQAGGEGDVALERVDVALQKALLSDLAADRYQAYRQALSRWNGDGRPPEL